MRGKKVGWRTCELISLRQSVALIFSHAWAARRGADSVRLSHHCSDNEFRGNDIADNDADLAGDSHYRHTRGEAVSLLVRQAARWKTVCCSRIRVSVCVCVCTYTLFGLSVRWCKCSVRRLTESSNWVDAKMPVMSLTVCLLWCLAFFIVVR